MEGGGGRRGILVGLLGVGLTGCGFRPIYATRDDGKVQDRLGDINVLLIPERSGQLLRQALQSRLERGGEGRAPRYDLSVQYVLSTEPIAIQRDNSTSRLRVIGTASWALLAQDAQRRTIANGTAREVDGYNFINQQFFASELTSQAVQRRLSEALAAQITTQLAMHFNRQAGG